MGDCGKVAEMAFNLYQCRCKLCTLSSLASRRVMAERDAAAGAAAAALLLLYYSVKPAFVA